MLQYSSILCCSCLALDRDTGRQVVTGSRDTTATLWELGTNRETGELSARPTQVHETILYWTYWRRC